MYNTTVHVQIFLKLHTIQKPFGNQTRLLMVGQVPIKILSTCTFKSAVVEFDVLMKDIRVIQIHDKSPKV